MVTADDGTEVLPASSVAVAVNVFLPSDNVIGVPQVPTLVITVVVNSRSFMG